ncbi:MAG: methyltransferase domain-containing protein [Pseudomonadota bacterium]
MSQYSEATLFGMQRIFGRGFLSPGGPAEIHRVLEGIALADKEVMDLGCGLGGGTAVLGQMGATSVLGIDIEAGNLAIAQDILDDAGLQERVSLRLVEPGPLAFADNCFDVVFSKAVICHVPDKAALFREVHRVIKPGGWFAGADWMKGGEGRLSQAFHDWDDDLRAAGLDFHFDTPHTHQNAFHGAGFQAVMLRDDSDWAGDEARKMQEVILGGGRDDLIAALGQAGYETFVHRGQARIEALASRDLQYRHFRAQKPA